ncbi:uncharacterized protein BT62DRAFT_929783 [Guyanagaster necrorhizus]|uniref:Uncharacterized protein n=1 Tax=Guyanagaster necrorhizus TaxID=856835 RepID=A0A9P7VXS3_9AGAR|nr:uncharacterized protein BT62DRAFT_929783 [Guyanagaster necrorhizus MCA 3950]KAG7448690.1 hypothetical protein BT62DRAFT_929783 [Guyanagaster necrorhizus MCA 3950]
MSPAEDPSARKAPKSTDDPTVVVGAQEIQPDKVTQPSYDPIVQEVVEDADGAQGSLLKPGKTDTKLEGSIKSQLDNSFPEPPPPPGIIPKGPITSPVVGGPKPKPKPPIRPAPRPST